MSNKILRLHISVLLIAVMLLGTIIPVGAAHDGFVEPVDNSPTKVVANVSNINDIITAGAAPSEKNARVGRYCAHWSDTVADSTLSFNRVEKDWSKYDKFTVDIYSEKAVKGKMGIVIYTTAPDGTNNTQNYFRQDVNLNFEGWQTITIDPMSVNVARDADWTKVFRVAFTVTGWTYAPDPNINIYINSIVGTKGVQREEVPPEKLLMNIPAEKKKEIMTSLGSNDAVMAFASKAIVGGKVVNVNKSDRVTTSNGQNIATLAFYKDVLKAKVTENGGKVSISYNDRNADVTEFVEVYDGLKYVPIEKVMELCQIPCMTHDLVTFIGDPAKAQVIADSLENHTYLKSILTVVPFSERTITKQDWKDARAKWRKHLVGDGSVDLNDPTIQAKIKRIDSACESAWNNMHKDTKIRALFGEKEVTVTDSMYVQYVRINEMAVAWGTYGSKYYKDPQLLADIKFALEWGYENLYGEDEMLGTGWKSTSEFNWWDWFCGVPQNLGETLIILGDEVPQADVNKYFVAFNDLITWMKAGRDSFNAVRILVHTLAGVLQERIDLMEWMAQDYCGMYKGSGGDEKGSAIQEDMLYIAHEYFAYSAKYGTASLLDRVIQVTSILDDTAFEVTNPLMHNGITWLKDTFEPLMYNGFTTSSMQGRSRGYETYETGNIMVAAVDLIGLYGKDDDIALKQMIRRNVNDQSRSSVIGRMNVNQVAKLYSILGEDMEDPEYKRSKTYYTGDAVLHNMGNWGVALQMSSSRIAGWESINGQNLTGWYQGDGAVLTYVDTEKTNYDTTYWAMANPHLVPGVTADTQQRTPASIQGSAKVLGYHDFVGMIGIDDLYTTAAMQHETHKWLEHSENVTTGSPGAMPPYHDTTTKSKKSWFMFDDEVVSLGTDVNASSGFEVRTCLDNKRLYESELKPGAILVGENKHYPVVSITASSSQEGNGPEGSMDDNIVSRWSSEGDQWIVWEMESAVPVGYVGIAFYGANKGSGAKFELETSLDGQNWTTVGSYKSSGTSDAMEAFDMKGTVAKYVRFNGHGRFNNETDKKSSGWNSLNEVKIYPAMPDGSMPVDGKTDNNRIYGSEDIIVDGQMVEKATTYTKTFTNPKWFHIENYVGYYLPEGGELVFNKVENQTFNFLEAWVTHGVNPKNGSYAYVTLPKTAEETKAYAENPDIKILSNTPEIQAVEETTLGVKGYVFWKEGTFEDITTDKPLIIMTQKKDAEYKVNVSDPTKLLDEAIVTLAGKWTVKEASNLCTITADGDNTVIKINLVANVGRPVNMTFVAK